MSVLSGQALEECLDTKDISTAKVLTASKRDLTDVEFERFASSIWNWSSSRFKFDHDDDWKLNESSMSFLMILTQVCAFLSYLVNANASSNDSEQVKF